MLGLLFSKHWKKYFANHTVPLYLFDSDTDLPRPRYGYRDRDRFLILITVSLICWRRKTIFSRMLKSQRAPEHGPAKGAAVVNLLQFLGNHAFGMTGTGPGSGAHRLSP
jgi:hypothetical protein